MVDVSDSLFISCFLVSDSHNFVPERLRPHDYGFRAYGELSRFVYCLLQKVKTSESLPLIEKWETYMLPNHSSFASVSLDNFLVGSRFLEYVSKLPSPSLRASFKQDCFTFFEDLISQILSTTAARSPIGRGMSAFCPEILVGGDSYSVFLLFGELVDSLVRSKWIKSADAEATRAEFQSFVRDQREMEWGEERDVGDIMVFYVSQHGFRSRLNLYRVSSSFLFLLDLGFSEFPFSAYTLFGSF